MPDGWALGDGFEVTNWTLLFCVWGDRSRSPSRHSLTGLVVNQRPRETDWQLTASIKQRGLLDGTFWQKKTVKSSK